MTILERQIGTEQNIEMTKIKKKIIWLNVNTNNIKSLENGRIKFAR